MKLKFFLSSLVLLFYALLGGGSFSGKEIGTFFIIILAIVAVIIIGAAMVDFVENKNKDKRLQMIEEDEKSSSDFDRRVNIGDDRCKLYFDASKNKVMIMRVMTKGIKKEYVDEFDFPGNDLAVYQYERFDVYDPSRRKLLTGVYDDLNIIYDVCSIGERDNNKNITINNNIRPSIKMFMTSEPKIYGVLIDECHGLIAISEGGKVKDVFNYINANSLPKKRGEKSSISTSNIGRYLFVMDEFFNVLVIIGAGFHKILNYSDIIEVSYVENGKSLYTKSMGRTVGGAVVGGMLMGGSGAVVGGLSGAIEANKEVDDMDIKILLRKTNNTSLVLHFNDSKKLLKTKDEHDKLSYDSYLKNANRAKDVLSVIIDKAKQIPATTIQQPRQSVPTGVADELAKLAKLKANGILTEEEFKSQKSKLLNM